MTDRKRQCDEQHVDGVRPAPTVPSSSTNEAANKALWSQSAYQPAAAQGADADRASAAVCMASHGPHDFCDSFGCRRVLRILDERDEARAALRTAEAERDAVRAWVRDRLRPELEALACHCVGAIECQRCGLLYDVETTAALAPGGGGA